jgi:hypothetical protein
MHREVFTAACLARGNDHGCQQQVPVAAHGVGAILQLLHVLMHHTAQQATCTCMCMTHAAVVAAGLGHMLCCTQLLVCGKWYGAAKVELFHPWPKSASHAGVDEGSNVGTV